MLSKLAALTFVLLIAISTSACYFKVTDDTDESPDGSKEEKETLEAGFQPPAELMTCIR